MTYCKTNVPRYPRHEGPLDRAKTWLGPVIAVGVVHPVRGRH